MFTLSAQEFEALRSQFATSNEQPPGRGGRRYAPRVFTEHGALMAATGLNSPRAVEVSVYVMRTFVRLRELMTPPDPPKRPIGFLPLDQEKKDGRGAKANKPRQARKA